MTAPLVLGVFAHPDDETFGMGGTLATLHAEGVRTALWVATDGEAGRHVTDVTEPATLAVVRRAELLRAAGALGVDRVVAPGFPDGGLPDVPRAALLASLVAAIRLLRPVVIVTFGPEGAPTGHRDHQVVSSLAEAAFVAAADPAVGVEPPYDRLAPHAAARLACITWPDPRPGDRHQRRGLPVACRVRVRDHRGEKACAFAAHASQAHHQREFDELNGAEEWFAWRAGVPFPDGATDLLAGLSRPGS